MWRCQKYKLITDNKRRLPGTPRRAQFSIGTHKHTAVIMFCWHTMPGHHTPLSRGDPHTSYPLSWGTDVVLCSSYQWSLVYPFQHISEFKFVFINALKKFFLELFWPSDLIIRMLHNAAGGAPLVTRPQLCSSGV